MHFSTSSIKKNPVLWWNYPEVLLFPNRQQQHQRRSRYRCKRERSFAMNSHFCVTERNRIWTIPQFQPISEAGMKAKKTTLPMAVRNGHEQKWWLRLARASKTRYHCMNTNEAFPLKFLRECTTHEYSYGGNNWILFTRGEIDSNLLVYSDRSCLWWSGCPSTQRGLRALESTRWTTGERIQV